MLPQKFKQFFMSQHTDRLLKNFKQGKYVKIMKQLAQPEHEVEEIKVEVHNIIEEEKIVEKELLESKEKRLLMKF